MDHVPVSGIDELESHLQQILSDPHTPLNAKLFDEVELQLNGTLNRLLKISERVLKMPYVASNNH